MLGLALAGLSAAGVLLVTAGAGWKPATNLSVAGENARFPVVAVNPRGAAIVAWRRFDGSQPPSTCCNRIEARFRPAGKTFGPVKRLSAAGQNAGSPRVSIGRDGVAAVAWTRFDGTDPPFTCCSRAQVRVRRPGKGFGSVQTLSAPGQDAVDIDIGVGTKGRAVAIWTREQTALANRRLQARFRSAGKGGAPAFRSLQTLSPAGESAYAPHLGVADDGRASLLWQRYDGSHDRTVVNMRAPGKRFAKRRNLSRSGDEADYHTVAVSPGGTTLAAWLIETAGINYKLETRLRRPHGKFGPISTLSGKASSGEPAVAIDAAGRATVIWEQILMPNNRIRVRTRPPRQPFKAGRYLTPASQIVQNPVLGVGPTGATVAGWSRYIDDPDPFCCSVIRARARRPHRAKFSAARTLSAGGSTASNLDLVVAPGRRATAVWSRFDGSDERVQAARYAP